MSHFIDLFSPETYATFSNSPRDVSGFRMSQERVASRVRPGDLLFCYVTRLSRWVGLLEVVGRAFNDTKPIFVEKDDPFVVRFKVKPLIWLSLERAIPIKSPEIWDKLSFTRKYDKATSSWTGKLRNSLNEISAPDSAVIRRALERQATDPLPYPLDEADQRRMATHTVRREDKLVTVSIPDDVPDASGRVESSTETRESTKIQALISKVGAEMGMSIWVPPSDRGALLKEWKPAENVLLQQLPLNYDLTTLKTIENIDVLWLKRRSIIRAFEVEHTTSIYSGILRMADLLALQPNMDIKLHIVAPSERQEKVFQELKRPVFSLLEHGPLKDSCTYLSYESLRELAEQKHLSHLSDSVLDEYAQTAE